MIDLDHESREQADEATYLRGYEGGYAKADEDFKAELSELKAQIAGAVWVSIGSGIYPTREEAEQERVMCLGEPRAVASVKAALAQADIDLYELADAQSEVTRLCDALNEIRLLADDDHQCRHAAIWSIAKAALTRRGSDG